MREVEPGGSELFEEITALPEYYPFRTERELLRAGAPEIAELAATGFDLAHWWTDPDERFALTLVSRTE